VRGGERLLDFSDNCTRRWGKLPIGLEAKVFSKLQQSGRRILLAQQNISQQVMSGRELGTQRNHLPDVRLGVLPAA